MQPLIDIRFRDISPTPAIEAHIRARASRLERIHPLSGCRVAVEQPHHHKNHGNHFRVRVALAWSGDGIEVTRDPEGHAQNEDLHAALDDAFDRARRVMVDRLRRQRERI